MNTFHFITAGKYENEESRLHLERDCNQRCRFGRNWWYWLPGVRMDRWNIDLFWLCFMLVYVRRAAR